MIRPDFLRSNDTVGIVSPAGPVHQDLIDHAAGFLRQWEYNVKIGRNAANRHGVFAGTDEERASDFQEMIDDKDVRAILCARGGYGTVRIIDRLDFSPLLSNPKWVIGFSDVTVLHERLNSLGIQSIHGHMANNSKLTAESVQSLRDTLSGSVSGTSVASNPANRLGVCEGELVGGNLSIIYSLRGVPFEYDFRGKILFIEDLNEYFYHIDRMMQNLRVSGILESIAGLVVGTMSGMKNGTDMFAGSVEDIILDAVKDYDYPVLFDFPSGHENLNHAMIFGAAYRLSVSEEESRLEPLGVVS